MRGRQEEGPGIHRTLEWIGRDDAGEAIARVVRVLGPVWTGWRSYRAVALDKEAKVIELRPTTPPDGAGWLARVLARISMVWDKWVADAPVNLLGRFPKFLSMPVRMFQSGVFSTYAVFILIGLAILLGFYTHHVQAFVNTLH